MNIWKHGPQQISFDHRYWIVKVTNVSYEYLWLVPGVFFSYIIVQFETYISYLLVSNVIVHRSANLLPLLATYQFAYSSTNSHITAMFWSSSIVFTESTGLGTMISHESLYRGKILFSKWSIGSETWNNNSKSAVWWVTYNNPV